jgi:hypothetical protein
MPVKKQGSGETRQRIDDSIVYSDHNVLGLYACFVGGTIGSDVGDDYAAILAALEELIA